MKKNNILYNQIMSDFSKIIKRHLNENDGINLTPYLDSDNSIDLSDLKKLPKEIILKLCQEILDNDFTISEYDDCDYKSDEGHFYIEYSFNTDNIYLKSLYDYEMELSFFVDFEFDYEEGQEGNYAEFEEPIPDRVYIKDVDVYDITLSSNDFNTSIDIIDENIKEQLESYILNSDIIEYWEEAHQDDFEPDYDYDPNDKYDI